MTRDLLYERTVPSSGPRETAPGGMEVERNRILEQCCSQEVVAILLQARKHTTNTTYGRIWERFSSMAEQRNWNPLLPEAPHILESLQVGLAKGLSSNILKAGVHPL